MTKIKALIFESRDVLLRYLRRPMEEIRQLPDWQWEHLIPFQIAVTAATGFAEGLFSKSIFYSVFVMPILSLILILVSCFFFYYSFQIFANRTVSFRKLFQLVLFANIPFFIFQIGAKYFAFLSIMGLAFTSFLLIIAFVDGLSLPRKTVTRLIASLYVAFLAIWLWQNIDGSRFEKSLQRDQMEAPEVKL